MIAPLVVCEAAATSLVSRRTRNIVTPQHREAAARSATPAFSRKCFNQTEYDDARQSRHTSDKEGNMRHLIAMGVLAASLVTSAPAAAQVDPHPAPQAPAPAAPDLSGAQQSGGFRRFFVDVGSDYKHFISWETAKWIGVGTGATLAIHPADNELREKTQDGSATLLSESAGATYGNLALQLPLAFGWWIAGHATGSSRAAAAGRDVTMADLIMATEREYRKLGRLLVEAEFGPYFGLLDPSRWADEDDSAIDLVAADRRR